MDPWPPPVESDLRDAQRLANGRLRRFGATIRGTVTPVRAGDHWMFQLHLAPPQTCDDVDDQLLARLGEALAPAPWTISWSEGRAR